jgi:hypothetical protein
VQADDYLTSEGTEFWAWECFRVYEYTISGRTYHALLSQKNFSYLQAYNSTDGARVLGSIGAWRPVHDGLNNATWERFHIRVINDTVSSVVSGSSTQPSTSSGVSQSIGTVRNQHYNRAGFDKGYFTGQWRNGMPHGTGTMEFDADNSYTIVYPSGRRYTALRYEGNWVDGIRRGEGTLTFRDGTRYVGVWNTDGYYFKGDMFSGGMTRYVEEIIDPNDPRRARIITTHSTEWISVSNVQSPLPTTMPPLAPPPMQTAEDEFCCEPPIPLYEAAWDNVSLIWAVPQPTQNRPTHEGYYLRRLDFSDLTEGKSLDDFLMGRVLNNGQPIFGRYVDYSVISGNQYVYQLQCVSTAKWGFSINVDVPHNSEMGHFHIDDMMREMVFDPLSSPAFIHTTAASWAVESIAQAHDLWIIPSYMMWDYNAQTTRIDFVRMAFAVIEKRYGWMQQLLLDKSLVSCLERGPTLRFNDVPFADFDGSDQYRVASLNALGIIAGRGGQTFAPYDNISRQEAAVLLDNLHWFLKTGGTKYSYEGSLDHRYVDDYKIASWATVAVYNMRVANVMSGVGNNHFDPQGDFTHQQTIVTFMNLLKNLYPLEYMSP